MLASFWLLLAVCACSPGTRSGDFGDFLVSEIDRLGGQRSGTNALPSLTARWTVQSDTNGFEIHLPDTPFAEVGGFLKQAYGEPHRAGTNDDGRAWMLYARGKYTRGHGHAGPFIIQRAVEYCGISAPTNALPAVGGKWRFSELEDDVLVILERDRYPAVEAFLRCAFGEPSFGPEDTIDGHKLEGYRLTSSGGGIMLTSNDDNTEVLVIRPRKRVK